MNYERLSSKNIFYHHPPLFWLNFNVKCNNLQLKQFKNMKNLITIGLPSKGRLKEGSINFFEKNNLKLTSNGGERNYFAQIENFPNIKIIYLHAKEIVQRLGDGTLDVGISGLDLLNESQINLQKKIEVKKKLDFGLYVVNSVQEEIGLRGAQMIAERIDPDVAIITDVTHDTNSPMYDKKKSGDIKSGKGPALTFGPAVQNNLLKLLIDTAKKNKIDHQLMAASRFTGTDTDAFAYSNDGVASALISLPLKYMHTTVETVHKDDVESCIKLMYESVLAIKEGQDFRYIK